MIMIDPPYTIYGLKHPRTGIVRYVGKARDVKSRVRSKYGARVAVWIRKLRETGRRPDVVIIETGIGSEWGKRERFWIRKLRLSGRRLLNVCDGGNGAHTHGGRLTEKYVKMLGIIPDQHIANMVGLSREAVSYHRNVLRLPMAPRSTRNKSSGLFVKGFDPANKTKLPKSFLKRIGLQSDDSLARESGLSRCSISRRRVRMGIPRRKQMEWGSGNSKLIPKEVVAIRSLFPKISARRLAVRYNVTVHAVYGVVNRETWKSV